VQPDPGPVVVIGLKEIYDAVTSMGAQMALLVHQHADLTRDFVEHKADHEARLRALERARWPLPSAAVLLSLGSLALAIVVFLTR